MLYRVRAASTTLNLLNVAFTVTVGFSCVGCQNTLLEAAFRGDRVQAAKLLEHGADVDAKNADGFTPLNAAILERHPDVAELLLKSGADVNAATNDGVTPLHAAARTRQPTMVAALIARGAHVNAVTGDAWTALHYAARGFSGDNAQLQEHIEVVKQLVSAGAHVNAATSKAVTPLLLEAESRCVETAQTLLDHGASVNAGNDYGWTPLHAATLCKDAPMVALLIRHGADVNVATRGRSKPTATKQELLASAICLAAYATGIEGVDVDSRAKHALAMTPLQVAEARDAADCARLLREAGATPSH